MRRGTQRSYSRRDRARLKLILRGKNLGFSLEEVAQYLKLYDADPSQIAQTQMLLARIERAIDDLQTQARRHRPHPQGAEGDPRPMRGAPGRQGRRRPAVLQGLAATMRLAVIADIHGNVAALEAVLADVKARGADGIVNLGDCVSGPLWPRETMDLLESLGSADRARQSRPLGCRDCAREACTRPTPSPSTGSRPPSGPLWATLPARVDLTTASSAVHGTLADDNQYLLEDIVARRPRARHGWTRSHAR